jgi:chromosomal replication initiator protein
MRGLDLPDEIAFYMATVIDTNIRELEGAITQIQVFAEAERRPIDLALVKIAIPDPAARAVAEPTLHAIVTVVTEFYGVRVTDVQSKKRPRSIAVPRQVCMYLARKHTRHSLEEIGGFFGGRDHTTVMYSVEAVDERRRTNSDFDAQVGALDERLRKSNG